MFGILRAVGLSCSIPSTRLARLGLWRIKPKKRLPIPNLSLALLGFPRLTARSVGRHNPLSLAHILPPIQPHQPKRNLNKQSPTYNSPPSRSHNHPTAPVAASDTSPQHSPQPNPNPAEDRYSPKTTYPASPSQSASPPKYSEYSHKKV
jgi:hypothetical protein